MKPTVLMVPRLPQRLINRLSELYEVIGPLERSSPDALPEGAAAARVLITLGGHRTDAALMDALPDLGLICCYGTGYEGVDRAEAARRGIPLTNAGDANATSVAEFTMGLVLASARQIVTMDRFMRAGQWRGNAIERVQIVPGLAGRRLGVYGLGAIGTRVASRAAAFEMEIGYHNRSRRTDVSYTYFDTLLGLADWCDILVVAVRASAENRHAVNAEVLQALGPQGHVVNVSRGIAVDEASLCHALETGVIAGAGLDVYENEPNVSERLRAIQHAVLTPHAAAFAGSAQETQQQLIIDNLAAFFAGRPLVSPVL